MVDPPTSPASLTAIVVNFNRLDLLEECLGALSEALPRCGTTNELCVVDNGGRPDLPTVVARSFGAATVIRPGANLGFPGAVNAGLQATAGEWVLLVNDDAIVEADAVRELLNAGRSSPEIGSVAAQVRFAGDPEKINSAGLGLDRLGVGYELRLGERADGARELEPVFGACGSVALYRRTMLNEIGGFDARFFFGLEDLDVAWRARAHGWKAVYAPRAVALHHDGGSAAYRSSLKYFHTGLNRVRVLAKNADPGMLRIHGVRMVMHDLAYVGYVALTDRSLAPLKGRIQGLREWRRFRRQPIPRRPVPLAPPRGVRGAVRRRRARSAG